MKQKVAIYWARRDLRLADNPALSAALDKAKKEGALFLPIFILEGYMAGRGPKNQFGFPSRVFLAKALPAFAENFSNFSILLGKGAQTIIRLSHALDVTVFVNEDIHPDFYAQIRKISDAGVPIKLYADGLTVSKDTKTGTGNIYSVFTPFKNAVWAEFCNAKVLPKAHVGVHQRANAHADKIKWFKGDLSELPGLHKSAIECSKDVLMAAFGDAKNFSIGRMTYDVDKVLDDVGTAGNIAPTANTYDDWYFDEPAALRRFEKFLNNNLSDYKKKRDGLDADGTSRMSVALAWGLVSARTLARKIEKHYGESFARMPQSARLEGPVHYISELIWREFYRYLMYHHPKLIDQEFQEKFRGTIKWADAKTARHRFSKWMRGETGYPIVDAAMREIITTGAMHNRARMIVASVLTKNLGVDWRWGQEYFRAMLIDLDESSNNGGWQWGASVGADPKPIRIFNPYLQAKNYDADGIYQKKFLPEGYFANPPELLIEHADARADALRRYGLSGQGDAARDY